MTHGIAFAILLATLICPAHAESSRQALQVAAPPSAVLNGKSALARNDWAHAIEAFAAAEWADVDVPTATRGLGAAHAGAGHELAAIAWYQMWLQTIVPGEAGREQVLDDIIRLRIRAEARIRRIAQEASDALDEIGEGDAARTARLRKHVIEAALARGDMPTAQQTVQLVGADDAERDGVWSEATLALAAEDNFEYALAAAGKITNMPKRNELLRSLESRRAASRQSPPATQWRALARELSQRREIVGLDAELQDVARGPAAEVPLRLLAIGSKLQAAYARIQRLTPRTR